MLLLLVLVLGGVALLAPACSVIYAARGSSITTHDGDVLNGTNRALRIEITR
jgi:hypothetical protein